jgi:tRNA A-37 threonylcarbamoyl transferase component Bud32
MPGDDREPTRAGGDREDRPAARPAPGAREAGEQVTSEADGRLLGGRYRVGREIGSGGFGVVRAATDELLGRQVAIKEIRLPHHLPAHERAVLRQRVMREARAAGRLHHPGLVPVFDVLETDGRPWIVMELIDGPSLATLTRTRGPLSRAEVAAIGVSLAYALEAAHRAGTVHRDVKPANVLMPADGKARLTDFGIALSTGDPTLTRTGMLLGSPSYIAPERARGQAGGPSSDVWALGATLFAAVEGTEPYQAATPLATLTAIVDGDRAPFQRAGMLAPILHDLMALDPSRRPSLRETRARLRAALPSSPRRGSAWAGSAPPAPPAPVPGPEVGALIPDQPVNPERAVPDDGRALAAAALPPTEPLAAADGDPDGPHGPGGPTGAAGDKIATATLPAPVPIPDGLPPKLPALGPDAPRPRASGPEVAAASTAETGAAFPSTAEAGTAPTGTAPPTDVAPTDAAPTGAAPPTGAAGTGALRAEGRHRRPVLLATVTAAAACVLLIVLVVLRH